jgi:polyisoprenyl-teichoic acid--peptidoglycan teichoic acid transferase
MRARYEQLAETPMAQASDGLAFMGGLYLAMSPWVVGFTDHSALTMTNVFVGITVALLGSDAGPGRAGARIDSLLVATFEPRSGAVAVFSVPRNLRDFPMPEDLAQVWRQHCPVGAGWELLNALYRCGTDRAPEAFAALYPDAGDPAATAVRSALGKLLGIPIEHHALVDMGGFVRLVDADGWVDVHVADPIRVRLSAASDEHTTRSFDIPAGMQHLDGEEALAFARSRTGTSDLDRMRRQRCLLASVMATADPMTLLRSFSPVLRAVEEMVTTNIPLRRVPELVALLDHVDLDAIAAIGLTAPDYQRRDNRPNLDAIRVRVQETLDAPAATSTNGGDTPEVCR